MIAVASFAAAADDCDRAKGLRFISTGDALSKLLTTAGSPDFKDFFREGHNLIGVNLVAEIHQQYMYKPVCDNQTVYTINVSEGQIVKIDQRIQR